MPGGQRHAPKPRQAAVGGSVDESRIADVIAPVVSAAGMDLEAVRVSAAGRSAGRIGCKASGDRSRSRRSRRRATSDGRCG